MSARRSRTCPTVLADGTVCGHPLSAASVKVCRRCWLNRGATGPVKPKRLCTICGERELSRSAKAVCWVCHSRHRAESYVANKARETPGADEVESYVAKRRLPSDYEEHLRLLKHFIGCAQQDYAGPATARASSTERIVVFSDLHAPFHHAEAFAAFLERERGADVCIFGGDLIDHYSVSRFLKYDVVPVASEIAAAQMIVEKLSETFPRVIIVEGNHDAPRFTKLMLDRLPKEAIEIVQYLSGGTLSIVEMIARQFANVEIAHRMIDGRIRCSWFVQHGDLIVSHAEKYSRVPMSVLRSVEDWFSDFTETLDLDPWRVLLQAHTHALSWHPYRGDRLLGETGCLCIQHGYQFTPRVGGRPQRLGWWALEQTNGVTDFATARPVWYAPTSK